MIRPRRSAEIEQTRRFLTIHGRQSVPNRTNVVLATRQNPLEQIEALKAVTFVMKEGSVFLSEAPPRREPGS